MKYNFLILVVIGLLYSFSNKKDVKIQSDSTKQCNYTVVKDSIHYLLESPHLPFFHFTVDENNIEKISIEYNCESKIKKDEKGYYGPINDMKLIIYFSNSLESKILFDSIWNALSQEKNKIKGALFFTFKPGAFIGYRQKTVTIQLMNTCSSKNNYDQIKSQVLNIDFNESMGVKCGLGVERLK